MNPARHVMILASAGAGKTYALTDRFVALLAAGAAPERIAALTFTRKAAGEFFDEILKKLARGAAEPAYAASLARDIGQPQLGPADFLRLLRAMIDAMHRLNLGTLDSFFARVVRAFPLELGLGGDFELLEEHAARLERQRVLRRMFAAPRGGPDAAQLDFIEAFKRATFGTEEKQLGRRLDEFLDQHAEIFLAAPERRHWGRVETIWPAGCAWLAAASGRAEAARALHAALPWDQMTPGQRTRWEMFFAELPGWFPGGTLPKPVSYLIANALKAWPTLAEVMVERRRFALPPAARAALHALISGLVGAELARRLEMTQGIFAVLGGYEVMYDALVRRGGRLTFADLQRLLQPVALTRDTSRGEARLFIDWRLDAQIDHWLLDEFQDTSFGQWSILRNLIDEAVQDATGQRSFFYVGDAKQAIFTWREGDPRLFREIFRYYNDAAPGTIAEAHLVRSFRSGPAVIAMVNRIFGDAAALARLFPADAAARWNAEWRAHESAQPALGGFAALRPAADRRGRFAETLRILQEAQPLARGLSVAILVQKNETAAELADFLRREGHLPALAEADQHVGTDNPLSCALLALLRAAAHPGDTAARRHVEMTPLAAVLARKGCDTPAALTIRMLREIHDAGFESTLERWVAALVPALPADDGFSRERGRQLVEAARLFDATGSRDVAEFVHFIERHTVRESDTAAVIRVMTIHKAKGLGFDLVIVPDLQGQRLAQWREGLAVQRAADRSVEWILDLPGGEMQDCDPVLAAHVAAAESDACYECFCLLYVALTRAKRAMYVVIEPVEKSQSMNFPRLLRDTLGETWSAGDPHWCEEIPLVASPISAAPGVAGALAPLEVAGVPRAPRRVARTATAAVRPFGDPATWFSLDPTARDAVEFGSAVHAALAKVEWGGPAAAAITGDDAAAAEARACITAPEMASVWTAQPAATVWRERAFEIVLDGAWVSGVFDRVIVEYPPQPGARPGQPLANGRPVRATVFDFKTDRRVLDESSRRVALARHLPQLQMYRRAVSILMGLPLERVGAEVIFTRGPWRCPVSPA